MTKQDGDALRLIAKMVEPIREGYDPNSETYHGLWLIGRVIENTLRGRPQSLLLRSEYLKLRAAVERKEA